MSLDFDDAVFVQSVPGADDLMKDALLSSLAEGERYAFLTASVNNDVVTVKVLTDIGDQDAFKYVLESALEQADQVDPDLGVAL
jgi:hypothetical protein